MAGKQITQKVIDFEFSRIQMKDESQHHFFDEKSQTYRYSQWNLNNIIMGLGLGNKNNCSIKWVGFQQNSYLDAFIYCLFKGCRNTDEGQNGTFIKLKFHIYQLAARFLKVSDQRSVVQILCSAQYAKKLSQYLNRNRIMYNLFDKLLKGYLESVNCEYQHQMEDLKVFSKVFNFIKFETTNSNVGVLHHVGQKFYIINEKNCYFIVEEEQQKIIQLKRIIQNFEQTQSINKNMAQPIFQPQNNQNEDYIPRRIYQYTAPKFIANGSMHNKKKIQVKFYEADKQKSKQKQKQKQKQKEGQTSQRRKNMGPLYKPTEKKTLEFRTTLNSNGKFTTQNPEQKGGNKSQQKQGRQRMKMYYKSPQARVKTGIIYTSQQKRQMQAQHHSQSKSKQKIHDENQINSIPIKKCEVNPIMHSQYNMKNPGFTLVSMLANDIFSHRNSSCKDLPRYQSPKHFQSTANSQNNTGLHLNNSTGLHLKNLSKKNNVPEGKVSFC